MLLRKACITGQKPCKEFEVADPHEPGELKNGTRAIFAATGQNPASLGGYLDSIPFVVLMGAHSRSK